MPTRSLSPADAHAAIENGGFDLLLMDLNLPDVEDGLALIRFAIGVADTQVDDRGHNK
jgi:CheY-like chemotaxis protein